MIPTPKRIAAVLVLILALGFSLRFAGIHFGLPTTTHTLASLQSDESIMLYSMERMKPARLDLYPGDALYWGTFNIYLQGFVSEALSLAGVITIGSRDYLKAHLREADKLYLVGRWISIVFGTLALYVMFRIGLLLNGVRAGLFSALLLAIAPVAVAHSFYARPDATMLFWAVLSLYFSLRLLETGEMKWYVRAGAAVGLATVSKYSGAVYALPLLLVCGILMRRTGKIREHLKHLLFSILAAAAAFTAVNPYLLIRTRDVIRYPLGIYSVQGAFPRDIWTGYFKYFTGILPDGLGWPLFLASLLGCGRLLRKGTAGERVVAIFSVLYLLRFGAPDHQLVVYCLPVIPFLLYGSARLFSDLWPSGWGKAAAVLVIGFTLLYTVMYKSLFCKTPTQELASQWIVKNIPTNKTFAMSKNDFWTPPVLKEYDSAYRILTATTSQTDLGPALRGLPAIARKADFVIISDAEYYSFLKKPSDNPAESEAIGSVLHNERFEEVARFERKLRFMGYPLCPEYVSLDWFFPNITIHILKNTRKP